jgi:hypothetical protein
VEVKQRRWKAAVEQQRLFDLMSSVDGKNSLSLWFHTHDVKIAPNYAMKPFLSSAAFCLVVPCTLCTILPPLPARTIAFINMHEVNGCGC